MTRTPTAVERMSSGSQFANRSDFDTAGAGRRDLGCHLDGFIEVPGFEQIEAGKLLFRFGERPIGDRYLAVADPHSGGCVNRMERLGGEQHPSITEAVAAVPAFAIGDRTPV